MRTTSLSEWIATVIKLYCLVMIISRRPSYLLELSRITRSIFCLKIENGRTHEFKKDQEKGEKRKNKKYKSIKELLQEKHPEFNKHITTHTFRYTHISLLAGAGMPIKAIMKRVGHSNMKTTLEIYNQVSSTTKEKIIQEVNSWIF
jgi:integrase